MLLPRLSNVSYSTIALFSAGTDSLLKAASTETGRVTSKILIPSPNTQPDPPSLIHALTPTALLLATDSSALHIYDLRTTHSTLSSKPSQTYHPHTDYVSSLTALPPGESSTSGFPKQWVTTGGSTLAVTDLRKGVLSRSEDQEEELLSSVIVTGLPARKRGRAENGREKVYVGGAGGVITTWERGQWDDQGGRIIVDTGVGGGESLDCMTLLPDGIGGIKGSGRLLAAGMGDGAVKIVGLGGYDGLFVTLRHADVDSVVGLGVDVDGRLISGGGSIVKIWTEAIIAERSRPNGTKRGIDSDSDSDQGEKSEENGEASSGEEKQQRLKKKKRRKGKAKPDVKQVLGFDDLD